MRHFKIGILILAGLMAGLTLFVFVTRLLFDPPVSKAVEGEYWKSSNNYRLQGKTKAEVIELLGEPDHTNTAADIQERYKKEHGVEEWRYDCDMYLSYFYFVRQPWRYTLHLVFDDTGKMVRADSCD